MDPGSGLPTSFIVGVEGRAGFYRNTGDFPLDASLVLGAGGQFREGSSVFLIPAGLSVGRRIDVRDSDISFVPYAQPTFALRMGNNNIGTDLLFTLGLGADVRVNQSLDLRLGIGLGDMDGISLGAAWIR
jgi:hypothetical protein